MKKLLFISPRCPVPPLLKGDQKRSYEFLQGLKDEFEVDLVTFTDKPLTKEDFDVLSSLSKRYWVSFRNKSGAFLHILTSFWKLRPFQHLYFESYKVQRLIDRLLLENDYDIVFCQLSRVADYVAKKKIKGLKVLDFQDRYSANMLRRAQNEVSVLKKIVFWIETQLLKRSESQLASDFDRIIFVSDRDSVGLELFEVKTHIVPVAVDLSRLIFKKRELSHPYSLIMFGNMGYFPNYDGAIWFINEVFPRLREEYPDIILNIIGPNPPLRLKALGGNGVFITGYVDDLQPYLDKAHIAVVPLRAGSGMQNKILEALATGLPVVCSDHAIMGSVELRPHVSVCQVNPDEFKATIFGIIENYEALVLRAEDASLFVGNAYGLSAVLDNFRNSIQS